MAEHEDRVTLRELKSNLKDALKKSGVLDTVKAKIRREFISNMHHPSKASFNPAANPKSLFDRALYSSIYHCLKSRGFLNSLSVFAAECGIENQSPLSEPDVVQALQYGLRSSIYQAVKSKLDSENSGPSVLELLIREGVKKTTNGTRDSVVQTESTQTVRDFLAEQTVELHKKYMDQLEQDRKAPVRSVEERMVSFERDCEDRYRRDLEMHVEHVRTEEMARVRAEEQLQARADREKLRRDLEDEYRQRISLYAQREEELTRSAFTKEKTLERSLYEGRQQILREMEEVKMREQAGVKKIELETQGLQSLEKRLKETQSLLRSREDDLVKRSKEVEELFRECSRKAREDALLSLSHDIEIVNRDKIALREENVRFSEEKRAHAELLVGAAEIHQHLRETQTRLLAKESELVSVRQQLLVLQSRHNDDEARVAEMLKVPVESLVGPNTVENLVRMMRRIKDLQKKVEDSNTVRCDLAQALKAKEDLDQVLAESNQQLEVARQNVKLVQEKFKAEMVKADDEISALEKMNTTLEANLSTASQRIAELETLLEQQRVVTNKVDRLARLNSKLTPQSGRATAEVHPASSKLFSSEVDNLLYKSTASAPKVVSSVPARVSQTGLSLLDIQELIDSRLATVPPPVAPTPASIPTFQIPPALMYNPLYLPPQAPMPPSTAAPNVDMTSVITNLLRSQREEIFRDNEQMKAELLKQITVNNTVTTAHTQSPVQQITVQSPSVARGELIMSLQPAVSAPIQSVVIDTAALSSAPGLISDSVIVSPVVSPVRSNSQENQSLIAGKNRQELLREEQEHLEVVRLKADAAQQQFVTEAKLAADRLRNEQEAAAAVEAKQRDDELQRRRDEERAAEDQRRKQQELDEIQAREQLLEKERREKEIADEEKARQEALLREQQEKEAEEERERQRNAELDAERNEEKKKQEEDQALIQAARAKVLERRRQKQLLDAAAEAPKSSLNISSPSSSVGHDSSGWLSASPKHGNISIRSPRNETGFDRQSPTSESLEFEDDWS